MAAQKKKTHSILNLKYEQQNITLKWYKKGKYFSRSLQKTKTDYDQFIFELSSYGRQPLIQQTPQDYASETPP